MTATVQYPFFVGKREEGPLAVLPSEPCDDIDAVVKWRLGAIDDLADGHIGRRGSRWAVRNDLEVDCAFAQRSGGVRATRNRLFEVLRTLSSPLQIRHKFLGRT